MNRTTARKIAETITNKQILQMFINARAKITDWTKTSPVNKGLTKGSAWNILAKNFDVNIEHHILAKTNMIWEFGDFLPNGLKPEKKEKKQPAPPTHHDPDFSFLDDIF